MLIPMTLIRLARPDERIWPGRRSAPGTGSRLHPRPEGRRGDRRCIVALFMIRKWSDNTDGLNEQDAGAPVLPCFAETIAKIDNRMTNGASPPVEVRLTDSGSAEFLPGRTGPG